MIPHLREDFNRRRYTPARYAALAGRMQAASGAPIDFRMSETPCFFPASLLRGISDTGAALTHRLVNDTAYLERAFAAIPDGFRVPAPTGHPHFMTADFGLVQEENGAFAPRLVELQAFPSIYGLQALMSAEYQRTFDLDPDLRFFLGGHDDASYWRLLGRAILGNHDPENVALLEVAPTTQKTYPDFLVHRARLGIAVVDITEVVQQGSRLFYPRGGTLVPIHRIYNRAIADEILRTGLALPFRFSDDLDVEWAGNPNWYFGISKFALPHLHHPAVPAAVFLDQWFADGGSPLLPADREQWVFKPLYSFAGQGIRFAPTDRDLRAIPQQERHNYLLQQRVRFAPVIHTPEGPTQAEIRIMYVWPDGGTLEPVMTLIRMGRGMMMGVDHNRDRTWVGASAGFFPPEA